MPDKVADFLRMVPTNDRVRAAAWDAIYESKDDAEREQRLNMLPLDDRVKARIWDLAQEPVEETSQEQPAAAGRFLSNAGQMLNPIGAVQGIASAIAHPIDTASRIYDAHAAEASKAAEAYQQGNYSEMAGHGLATVLPILGPAAAQAGEQIASGDVAGGLGKGAGLVTGAALTGPAVRAAGRVMQPAAQAIGRRLYQSALKPTKAVLKDVRPVAGMTAQQTLLQTGLNEAVPVTARGVQKVDNLIDSLNTEVQARVRQIQASGEKVDPTLIDQAIKKVARDFTNQVNAQPDLQAIETVRQNFRQNPNVAVPWRRGKTKPGPIDPDIAQTMKTNTYQGLRGKYGQERGATIEAEKAGARGLRRGIEEAGQRAGVTDIADINAREGSLISLEHALEDAMRRRGNYDVLGLKPAIGAATATASGSALPLLVTLVDRFPGIVSRAGIWINRAGTTGRGANVAGKVAVFGTTIPTESRSRTTRSRPLEPQPAR